MEKTEAQIGIRVTNEFKERLEAKAEPEPRPVAKKIRNVMEDYQDPREKEAEMLDK